MVFFMVLIAGLGFVADLYVTGGGPGIVFYAVVIGAIAYVAIQYYSSGSQALSMAGARQIQKADNPRLYRIVENLAITTGLPMPNVYLVDDPAPNAFATGRDPEHAAVAATTGLLDIMDDAELEGVMAHEIAHVKNFDIRVTTIVFGLVVVVGLVADVLARMAFFWRHASQYQRRQPVNDYHRHSGDDSGATACRCDSSSGVEAARISC